LITIIDNLSKPVSEEKLQQLNRELKNLFIQFKNVFGEQYCTANTHFLLHLVKIVKYVWLVDSITIYLILTSINII